MPRLTHILLAEDNEDDVFLLRQALRKVAEPASLHVVPDGAEAVAWLKGMAQYADRKAYPQPDILLLDLNMPRLNGFEVLKWVRSDPQWNQLMVHVMTASIRDADVKQVYELRANSYVLKPTRQDELVDFLNALHLWHKFVYLSPTLRAALPPAPQESDKKLSAAGTA